LGFARLFAGLRLALALRVAFARFLAALAIRFVGRGASLETLAGLVARLQQPLSLGRIEILVRRGRVYLALLRRLRARRLLVRHLSVGRGAAEDLLGRSGTREQEDAESESSLHEAPSGRAGVHRLAVCVI
jgi:hypothetical protein